MRLIVLVPLLAAIPGAALAEPLAFDAALQRAANEAPSLKASASGVDAARSVAIASGRLPDPTLSVGIDNFPVSGPPAFSFTRESMTMTRIGAEAGFYSRRNFPNRGRKRHPSGGRRRDGRKHKPQEPAG